MGFRIKFQLEENSLCFEVIGSIRNHMDSIAAYVMCRIAESRIRELLLDVP